MKLITFNYTDAKGKKSIKYILRMYEPSHLVSGIDVSDLDPDDAVAFETEMLEAKEAYDTKIKQLQETYDLLNEYRQYKPERMEDTQDY